jgi:hypothetical protein
MEKVRDLGLNLWTAEEEWRGRFHPETNPATPLRGGDANDLVTFVLFGNNDVVQPSAD